MIGWIRWRKFHLRTSSRHHHQKKKHGLVDVAIFIVVSGTITLALCGVVIMIFVAESINKNNIDLLTLASWVSTIPHQQSAKHNPPKLKRRRPSSRTIIDGPKKETALQQHSGQQSNVEDGSNMWICPVCKHKWDPRLSPRRSRKLGNRQFCPKCQARERHRLMGYFLNTYENTDHISFDNILHIAPVLEPGIQNLLKERANSYTAVDIKHHPWVPGPLVLGDVRNMTSFLDDDSISLIVCSHVLEHVQDPLKALAEFRRVLKKDYGMALIMVPLVPETSITQSLISDQSSVWGPASIPDDIIRSITGGGGLSKKAHGDDNNVFSPADTHEVIAKGGFHVQKFVAPEDAPQSYHLPRDDILFIARPSSSSSF